MRYAVVPGLLVLLVNLIGVRPISAAGEDDVTKLKAKVEQLEAENKSLKDEIAALKAKLAAPKKAPAKLEVVIDIDGIDEIRIGEKKATLTTLRQQFENALPSQVE